MAKGYLCTWTVLCTTVFSMTVGAQETGAEGLDAARQAAEERIGASLTASLQRASQSRSRTSDVSGWSVTIRPYANGPKVTVAADDWTIAADDIEGDRLVLPRAIGSDVIVHGTTGRLLDGGLIIEDAIVTTRQTTVSAARAELTLPRTVKLTDVGTRVQPAE